MEGDAFRLEELPGEAKVRPYPQGIQHFLVLLFELLEIMRECRASSDWASDLGCSNTSQNGSLDRTHLVQHHNEMVHGPIVSPGSPTSAQGVHELLVSQL
jgi:hypothetical protein